MAANNITNICPYNQEVECDTPNFEHCGWYPPVAKKRKEEIMRNLKLYRVPFTGYCEVWAMSPEEATKKAETVEQQFTASYDYGDPICLSKEEADDD